MRKLNKSYIVPALIIVLAVTGLAVALAAGEKKPSNNEQSASSTVQSICGPYRDDVNTKINGQIFKTEITKTQQAQQKGLAGRPCITDSQAMLFSFTKPGQYAFWMKGMKFPIDILWISSEHRVVAQEINVSPSTYHSSNPYFENDPSHLAQYVLEMKANRSQDLHVTLGTPVVF